ncbi:MAG: Tryptophan synthase alpha chain [Myxococcaceae bacterium]|nr:Tryptophan synthase alpha chain [Myxococcaceae bacterium]
MRRVLLGGISVVALGVSLSAAPGCGGDSSSTFGGGPGGDGGVGDGACTGFSCGTGGDTGAKPGCVGLECQQLPCDNGGKTTVSGIVYDPAGKVPIYNATVYVPNAALADIPDGAKTCDRCDAAVSGKPIAIAATDTSGRFTLENVPVADKVPLVIQIGKWRRQVEIPSVAKCADTPVDKALTSLPKNRTQGNIPRMALSTGGADPLQCLLRKMGVDDSEFGIAGSDARIHLYAGGGFTEGAAPGTPKPASSKFAASVSAGASYASSETLWSSLATLQNYDLVLLSCEGDENEATAGAAKPDPAKQALYDYAKGGGRVFASHYHEVWLRKSPVAEVKSIATWADPERQPPAAGNPATTAVNADISGSFPKAVAMKDWLTQQNALTGGKLPIFDARHNVDAVSAGGLQWISLLNANAGNTNAVQYMSFNTPVGAADDAVCGRVVFSNLHVGAGMQGGVSDSPQAPFPDGCQTTDLSAQQKALEFMLFDLSSCVQKDDAAIQAPR